MDEIPFECRSLDAILGGGVERGCITLIYGEAGSGKTNLSLILSRNVARKGQKVFYVDTEGVSMERLKQISGEEFEEVLKNILVSEIHTFQEQEKMVDRAVKLAEGNEEVGLIVLDSISMYYRSSSRGEAAHRKDLSGQSTTLLRIARKRKIPVVITTQVFTDVDKGTFEALGGHALLHNAKTIIRLEKVSVGRRRATVMKHRHVPEGVAAEFAITHEGISCAGSG